MKKLHHSTLKFHTIYSLVLAVLLLSIVLWKPDILLFASVAFFVLYIGGNGIIHTRKNELKRDTLIEYSIVAAVMLIVLASVIV